jgi:hypothetical protein
MVSACFVIQEIACLSPPIACRIAMSTASVMGQACASSLTRR